MNKQDRERVEDIRRDIEVCLNDGCYLDCVEMKFLLSIIDKQGEVVEAALMINEDPILKCSCKYAPYPDVICMKCIVDKALKELEGEK